jgi:hypothetical protein
LFTHRSGRGFVAVYLFWLSPLKIEQTVMALMDHPTVSLIELNA